MQDLDDGTASKRRAAGEHLEKNGARGEKIAASVDGFAHDLFGRHVARCPHRDTGAGQPSAKPDDGSN